MSKEKELHREAVYEMLGEGVDAQLAEKVYLWSWNLRNIVYNMGYQAGAADNEKVIR